MAERKKWEARDIIKIAKLHYEQGWNEQRIADHLKIPRSTINRKLREAQTSGLFQIRVVTAADINEVSRLPAKLKKRYPDLRDVHIAVGNTNYLNPKPETAQFYLEEILNNVANKGAFALKKYLTDNSVVAVGAGELVKRAVSAVRVQEPLTGLQIVPMTGYLSPDRSHMEASANLAGELLQRRAGGRFHWLPVVGTVSPEDKPIVESLPIVRDTLPVLRGVTTVITSVRPVDVAYLRTYKAARSYVGTKALTKYVQNVAGKRGKRPVGVMGNRAFYKDKTLVPPLFSTIGMELEEVQLLVKNRSGNVIVIAAAASQARLYALDAAIRCRLCNVLVADHITLNDLLQVPQIKSTTEDL